MKYLLKIGVVSLVLVALLTWFLARSFEPDDGEDIAAQRALDDVALNESVLFGDVLSARAGLLQNYDPIVKDVEGMRAAASRLDAVGLFSQGPSQAIRAAVSDQESLVESFKTDNALLQNTLAYFDLLSDKVAQPSAEPHLAAAVGALASSVTHLARDASPDVALMVRSRLDELSTEPITSDVEPDMEKLLQRARLLLDLLPVVDDMLRRLPTLTTAPVRTAIHASLVLRRTTHEQRASRFRLALYVAALLLVGLLLLIGLRLRARALQLQRRANLEHLIGKASNLLLASQPEEFPGRLDEVLGMFGEGTDSDRVYVLRLDKPLEIQIWSRPGVPAVRGWPEALLDMARSIESIVIDPIRTPDHAEDLPLELKTALRTFGIESWSCAKLAREDKVIGLLCLDRCRRPPSWLKDTLNLLRMEGDVVGNALHREQMILERTALENRLQRAQRLEAIGTFTSGIAHNFNNVIGSVLGHAEMAADALPSKSPAGRHVAEIAQAGERARAIVGQILDFGRRGYAARHMTSLDTLLAETVSLLQPIMPMGIDLVASGTADGALTMGEPAQLQQVLINLIRNAEQASEAPSQIITRIERLRLSKRLMLSHGAVEAGDFVRVTVADSGRGMDPATQAKVFDPFFTTRSAGTGLGLATAREVVNEIAGGFDVRSVPGQGSTFEVWLPAITPELRPPANVAPGGTVMLVGTDQRSVMRDEELLAALGYEPVGFAVPHSALAALTLSPERFDLIIVEKVLPGTNGMDFAKRAAASEPRRPIILSTSSAEIVEPKQLYLCSIADIVRRPWRSGAIAATLERNLKNWPRPLERRNSALIGPQ